MALRKVPAPSCPDGHARSRIQAYGTRQRKKGTTRRWLCRYEEDGEAGQHWFSTVVHSTLTARDFLDEVVSKPPCPNGDHAGWRVDTNGTYDTLAGPRQRYRCSNPDDPSQRHTFTAPLPRSAVEGDTRCEDCHVPTPRNAGTEAPTRRLNVPAAVVHAVLNDLAEGRSYTHASMRALERMDRTASRTRSVRGIKVDELNQSGETGPDRDMGAHWHISADILERFAPLVTEPAFDAIRAEETSYRAKGLPVVYVADEVPVKRNYTRWASTSPVVWNVLVIGRMQWVTDSKDELVGRSSKLVRVRAMPSVTKDAWALVFSELEAPDFLIADGAAAIEKAAGATWGKRTTFVPCVWHASENIRRRLTPTGGKLDENVRDHLYALTREAMAAGGPATVSTWFDELEDLADASGLPMDTVAAVRAMYEPLLCRSAKVAASNSKPRVPISNASVENQIATWVDRLVARRGAMFANLPRTNLLGDLIVAGANGALLHAHDVITVVRDSSRANGGWAPPPRALVEPAGASSLRDPGSITELLRQVSP